MELHRIPGELLALHTDPWTAPFFTAARDGRLVVARCAACGTWRMPPFPFCPKCRSQEITWREASGEGSLYSYTIVHHPLVPDYADCVPYAVGVMRLDDAPVRLVGNLVEVDSEAIEIGMHLTVGWTTFESGAFPVLLSARDAAHGAHARAGERNGRTMEEPE
jgi:uncharacterized OB-fold protein